MTLDLDQPTPLRSVRVPARARLRDDRGIAVELLDRLDETPDAPVLAELRDGTWHELTAGRLAERVRAVAAGLVADGVAGGERIALLGANGTDWLVLDLAVLAVGAVVVPVYPTSSPAQITHQITDSGATRCLVQAETHVDAARAAGAPRIETFAEAIDRLGTLGRAADRLVPDLPVVDLPGRLAQVRADDVATIVYTSGTTGVPKGCVLTHRNLFAAAANVVELLPELFARADASTLFFLPLAHVFGRVTALGCLWARVRTGLLGSAAELTAELPRFRPSFLVLVPYALERIRKSARRAGLEAEAERAAVAAGLAGDAWSHPAAGALRAGLGGRLRQVICGGATLDPTTAAFVTALGVQVLGAYGLTEASTAVSMSAPGAVRPGRVGRPLPGSEVAVAADGEVLVRGDQVSPGYWPLDTPAPAAQDWLRTGDLGELDADGFLAITGRRKEIIVTSGGKNVSPEPLEDRIRLHPLVSSAVVVGEGRPYVAALITVEPDAGAGADPDADPDLRAAVAEAVAEANALVSRAESVRRFRLLPGAFTVSDGLLTPSLKLRRAAITERFAREIDELYREGERA